MRHKSAIVGLILAVALFAASAALAQEKKAQAQPQPKAAAPAPAPAAAPAAAQAPGTIKIGFVSVAKVLEQCEDGKKIKSELDKMKDQQTKQLESLKSQLDKLEEEIKSKSMVWDEYTRQLKQSEYYTLAQKAEIEKRRMEKEFQEKREQLLPPFEDKVGKILEKIGKDGGYTIILDTSPLSPALPLNNILYANESYDITDQVIQQLNQAK